MQPMNPMTKTMVFEGNELSQTVPVNNSPQARCAIRGQDSSGKLASFPLSDDLLSKHLLFIGGIGMGKTNGIFQILSQLRNNMTSNDVMVVFDTKGDFYDSFYRQGDIVISNDDKATGPRGRDYWNIFEEINAGINTEEEIVEIARALFFERSIKSSQPFFPNAARDLFSGIMLHFHRLGGVKNNAVLRNFLDQTPSAEIRAILQQHQDLKAMTSYISDDRSPQTQGVISELQQHLREYFYWEFQEGRQSLHPAGNPCETRTAGLRRV